MQPNSSSIRLISGRYRGAFPGGEVELRVDVDGFRTMNRLSGDFFQTDGGTVTHSSSFVVDAPSFPENGFETVIEGMGRFSDSTVTRKMRVTIARNPALPQPQFAILQVLQENGLVDRTVLCAFESGFFRTVTIREAAEAGVSPFVAYHTGSIPTPAARPRRLTVIDAFSEAGIEMEESDPATRVRLPRGGTWSNAELHEAMERGFESFPDVAQWRVWLFHARRYEKQGTVGLMFDEQGRERQGCAVFYSIVNGNRRKQLHACMHEIGHCFNLYHSFAKSPVLPNVPIRRDALSWMNYPWEFPNGASAFWRAFPFQFDDAELIHLRHGFRDDVIMGGRPFEGASGLVLEEIFRGRIQDESGLDLRLEGPKSIAFGEPLWVELRLSIRGDEPRAVHTRLHPREGCVQIAIRKPGGEAVLFDPLFRRCMEEETTVLNDKNPAIYESAFLGYGKRGFYFRQPGFYEIRAVYTALDGSRVLSNPLRLKVRNPFDRREDRIGDLFLGDEQGNLIAFRGSDAGRFSAGNVAFERVIEQYGDHPLASYARMVKGYNRAREFKFVGLSGEVYTRPSDPEGALRYLEPMVADFVAGKSAINNLTFGRTIHRLAQAQLERQNRRAAEQTLGQLEDLLQQRRAALREPPFKPHVVRQIRAQVAERLGEA